MSHTSASAVQTSLNHCQVAPLKNVRIPGRNSRRLEAADQRARRSVGSLMSLGARLVGMPRAPRPEWLLDQPDTSHPKLTDSRDSGARAKGGPGAEHSAAGRSTACRASPCASGCYIDQLMYRLVDEPCRPTVNSAPISNCHKQNQRAATGREPRQCHNLTCATPQPGTAASQPAAGGDRDRGDAHASKGYTSPCPPHRDHGERAQRVAQERGRPQDERRP
jgi:hypothetical protein